LIGAIPGLPLPLARLVELLASLPGIGPKTALRLSLNLMQKPAAEVGLLAEALASLHAKMGFCPQCGAFAEMREAQAHCAICEHPRRDAALICIVEQPVDVLMLERSGSYSGHYCVLHGRLSPIDGIGPGALNLAPLDRRIAEGRVRELILATSATVDGEATAHFLARRYRDAPVSISRISRGVPEGSELEYLDEHTLGRALSQRVAWERGEG